MPFSLGFCSSRRQIRGFLGGRPVKLAWTSLFCTPFLVWNCENFVSDSDTQTSANSDLPLPHGLTPSLKSALSFCGACPQFLAKMARRSPTSRDNAMHIGRESEQPEWPHLFCRGAQNSFGHLLRGSSSQGRVMWGVGWDSAVQPHSMGGARGERRDTHTHTQTHTHTGTYTRMLHLPFSDLPLKKCQKSSKNKIRSRKTDPVQFKGVFKQSPFCL